MTTDQDVIVLAPSAPLLKIYFNGAGWSKADRCPSQGPVLFEAPVPADFVVSNGLPGTPNSGLAVLLADGRTLKQTQPFARCVAGASGTSQYLFADVDIHGLGSTGCHGGSGLSCLGGALRNGELRPHGRAPRHVLKADLFAHVALHACTTSSDCFRWPAVQADSYAASGALAYGTGGGEIPSAMKMGALLALPESFKDSRLQTEPARQLAWTLRNYGAYVVDDAAWNVWALVVEVGPEGDFRRQFQQDWGFPIEDDSLTSAWSADVKTLFTALAAVDDNGPGNVGGAGYRLQPLAPPFQ